MIPKKCKRLAEVDFPIAVVSAHSAREKSIRHGNPSTLHLWWARRPLAACRAMLLALLLPDPCDENCPSEFKIEARALLSRLIRDIGKEDIELRKAILKFIGDFANWDYAANPTYLEVSRGLVKAAHGEEVPLVVDPFAGGGSIPVEALRLGCEAFASDLNPVACLISKVMLEDIPRHGPKLAEELCRVGAEIKKGVEKELGRYYPPDPDGAAPIAYLWARTVRCESPNCGAEIPLVRSFWLCKKANRLRALRARVLIPKDKIPQVELEVFTPKSEKEVAAGTVTRAKATCLACGRVLAPDRVRTQLRQQNGGADTIFDAKGARLGGARLVAVVTLKDDKAGRQYRVSANRDYEVAWKAQKVVAKLTNEKLPNGLSVIPDEPTPAGGGSGAGRAFSVQNYGMMKFGDLFTARQKLALVKFAGLVSVLSYESGILRSTARVLAASLSRLADKDASLAVWNRIGEKIEHVFGRQALPIVWDFAEVAIFSDSTGNLQSGIDLVHEVAAHWASAQPKIGQVQPSDACEFSLPDDSSAVWFTDPPYYDAVPYADLSDFFYVWLKRALPDDPLLREPVTAKEREIVQDETKSFHGQSKDREFFEERMALAFAEGRRVLKDDGIGSVVFAHKTTEGWEALLSGMIKGGWTITGSWPVSTERPGRLRAQDSAALATSVHLICRPRPKDAGTGDWGGVLRELPNRIGDWMERLSAEGVRGADLVFACIGPAMEVFSRYSRVEDAEGREIPLGGDPEATEAHERGFLAYVWEIVGRTALGQVLGTAEARARNGGAGALEEDARLTALFLWTVQSTSANSEETESSADGNEANEVDDEESGSIAVAAKKGLTLVHDVVRRFSQPLGIHLEIWEARIVETKKGMVRLLPVGERAETLFGEDGASGVSEVIERSRGGPINYQFGFMRHPDERAQKPNGKFHKRGKSTPDKAPTVAAGTTTLDRLHIAMLLQASGKSNALRTMLKAEVERGPDFLRLASALSALYPRGSEEKRLLDAMLLAAPR
jgi:putative DNA methylase